MSAITICQFRFYGNSDATRIVSQWKLALKACEDLTDPILLTEKCFEIFEVGRRSDLSVDFLEYNDDFRFLFNRFPSFNLPKLLLERLFKYDQEVIVEFAYDFEGSFGYQFLANRASGKLFDEVNDEISAFRIDWDAHGEIYFDEDNDDGGEDMQQLRQDLEKYYRRRISNIEKLRIMFPARNNDLNERENFVRRRLKIALAKRDVGQN